MGFAAKMRKHKKTRQIPKKELDRSSKKNTGRRPKGDRNKQSVVSPVSLSAMEGIPEVSGALPIQASDIALPERPKRGRPTIPDNFLLGFREGWLYYLEECWPEFGWHLLRIRKAGNGKIADIQKIFGCVPRKDHCRHGEAFLSGSPQPVSGMEFRANRLKSGRLRDEIQRMRDHRPELVRSCREGEEALKQVGEQEREKIGATLNKKRGLLSQLDQNLNAAEMELKKLDRIVPGQETYWYCSQLLDYLCGKKKYAVEPLSLANALAGLPEMGWRESFARCSKMPRCSEFVQLPYQAFEVISRIWHRRPKNLGGVPTEFFRAQILALPRKDDGIHRTLCQAWRDLRLAIEECWQAHHGDNFIPYAITSAFIRNRLRAKTPAERILDESEMLSKGSE